MDIDVNSASIEHEMRSHSPIRYVRTCDTAVAKQIMTKRRVKGTAKATTLDLEVSTLANKAAKSNKKKAKKAKKAAVASMEEEAYHSILEAFSNSPCKKCEELQESVTSLEEELKDARDAIRPKKLK